MVDNWFGIFGTTLVRQTPVDTVWITKSVKNSMCGENSGCVGVWGCGGRVVVLLCFQ